MTAFSWINQSLWAEARYEYQPFSWSILMKYFLLLAVIASFCPSSVTAQIKPPPRAGQFKDVIVSSEGVREGKLAGCVGGVCSMDNVSTARIVWIGLKADVRSRPSPSNPAKDEVRYHDGSVHAGRLVGINADLVVTERGRHQRAMVAWVYLAPKRETGNVPGQFGAPGKKPGETVIKPPIKDDKAGGEPPVAVPSSGPLPPGKRGGLWTGKITSRWVKRHPGGVERITTTIDDVRLREYVQPMHVMESGKLRQVGTITSLVAEGGKISERLRDLYNAGDSEDSRCSVAGEGTTKLIGDISSSYIWKKTGNVDTTSGVGWNVPSGPGLYFVGLSIHTLGGYTTTTTCVGRNRTEVYTEERGFHTLGFGRIPPDREPIDPELRFLDSTSSRMIGSYTNTRTIQGDGSLTLSWSICREGVKCAAPPTAGDGAVSLGNLFETDLDALLTDVKAKLDGVLSKLQTDPGLMPEIRVIVKGGGDPIFVKTLATAQIHALKAWFAERGIDASRISWAWETGASDQVSITY